MRCSHAGWPVRRRLTGAPAVGGERVSAECRPSTRFHALLAPVTWDGSERAKTGAETAFWWSTPFWCYSTSDPFQLRYSLLWALWVVLGLLSIQVYTGSVTSCEACEPDRDRADRSVVHSCFGSSRARLLGRDERKGTLAVDGSGVGVPGGAGRDPAGARGMVRGARRPVPAKAMAPAHPQAGAVPRPRRRPGPHDSIINDVSFRLPTLVGCILEYSVRLDQFRATWLLFTCDR